MSQYCLVTCIAYSCCCFCATLLLLCTSTFIAPSRFYEEDGCVICCIHQYHIFLCMYSMYITLRKGLFPKHSAKIVLFSKIPSFCYRNLFKSITGSQRMIQTTSSTFLHIFCCCFSAPKYE